MSAGGEGRRSGGIFPRLSVSEDVDREIRIHLEMRAEELEAEGWEPTAAREEARRLFGDARDVARRCRTITISHHRAVRRTKMLDAMWQDVRYAVRTLLRTPGFAIVALLTLALGIGANAAIFSVVDGILLRPLPWDHPEQLVWISEINTRGHSMAVAWPNLVDWRRESTSFTGVSPVNDYTTTVLGGEEPMRVSIALVGEDFWKIFPVQPLRGRLTNPDDHVPGSQPVVVVSHSFWQNELGGRDLDSYSLEVEGAHVRVVGVLPDGAVYPRDGQMWTPAEPQNQSNSRTSHNWSVVGRIAPGVGLERARQEIDAITKRVVDIPDEDPAYLATGARTIPLTEEVIGDVRGPLYLLLGAAALVLLVACTNLASTLLARGSARARELAVRASLGARRGRIVTQLLTESLLLSLLGAALGVGLATLVVRAIRSAAPGFLPRLDEVGIDGTVLLFTAVIAVVTALLFGVLPARRLSRVGAGEALRSGSRGNADLARGGIWRFLVGTEVALALVLLAGSALLVRSFRSVMAQEAGFDASDVEVMPMSLSQIKYPSAEEDALFYDRFLAELRALPGVSAAGVMSVVPVQNGLPNGRMELDGNLQKTADGGYVVASGGAFEALDIPLVDGRLFDERDGPGDEQVAIVNEAFADRYWPGESAVGKSVTGGGMDNFYDQHLFVRVIGVVGNVRSLGLTREAYPTVYFAYRQRPFRLRYESNVVVEAANGDAAGLTAALRERLRVADPDVPVRIRTLASAVSESVGERRFVMWVLGGFSLTALILAAVGIFGVVSYSVARRTREMGIRMALGADPGRVLRLVMSAAMRMVVVGLIVGVGGALALTRVMRSLLYGVSPTDPLALVGATLLLGGAALLASWLPARAGTRVDPMITMRTE